MFQHVKGGLAVFGIIMADMEFTTCLAFGKWTSLVLDFYLTYSFLTCTWPGKGSPPATFE